MKIRPVVNGRLRELEVEAHALLLDVLRDGLDLKGAKRSCDTQVCGACTVLVDGLAVSACTYLAVETDGRAVLTVEGLADGETLHPLQRAFVEAGAVQCGFCTPGLIVASHDLLARNADPTDAEIREALAGNLCRCTGYEKILDAVRLAAERMAP
jgi:aerobic carbon-monoxide dehydrogenase small subunit